MGRNGEDQGSRLTASEMIKRENEIKYELHSPFETIIAHMSNEVIKLLDKEWQQTNKLLNRDQEDGHPERR